MKIYHLILFTLFFTGNFANAQWEKLYQFNSNPGKILYARDTFLISSPGKIHYSTNGTSWTESLVPDLIIYNLVSTHSGFFFQRGHDIYQFLTTTDHKKLFTIDTIGELYATGENFLNVAAYGWPTFKIYLSKYSIEGNKIDSYRQSYSGDHSAGINDSILFLGQGTGSGGYHGTDILNMNQNFWTRIPFHLFNTIDLTDGEVGAIIGKGCEEFYYSPDYGKTHIVNTLPNEMFGKCWNRYSNVSLKSILKKVGDQYIFISNNASYGVGVWTTQDLGKSWTKILSDSVIISAEVVNDELYVLSNKGTLLKRNLSIVTSTDHTSFNSNNSNTVIFYNNTITNNSTAAVRTTINDLNGIQVLSAEIIPSDIFQMNLKPGLYIMQMGSDSEKRKIVVY